MAGKVCKGCLVEKDINAFPLSAKNSDGHMGICRECKRIRDNEYSRRRNVRDHEKVLVRNAAWAKIHREQDLARKRKYNSENRDHLRDWHRDNYKQNRDSILAYGKERLRVRRRTDLGFRLKCVLRSRLGNALGGRMKLARTMELLGCPIEELRRHLEGQFRDGMTWENYGKDGWHVDHIKPCASFDLLKEEEQRKCFHFTNLQPLWAVENRAKGAKVAA